MNALRYRPAVASGRREGPVARSKRALYRLTVALCDAARGHYRAALDEVPVAENGHRAAWGCCKRMESLLACLHGRRVARRDIELARAVLASYKRTHNEETGEPLKPWPVDPALVAEAGRA